MVLDFSPLPPESAVLQEEVPFGSYLKSLQLLVPMEE